MEHTTMRPTRRTSVLLPAILVLAIAGPLAPPAEAGFCTDCCGSSPLILDLPDQGFIRTSSLSLAPVKFDIDADSFAETMGWTYRWSHQAFLWLDLNMNGVADDGAELFGTATVMPDGSTARNGFLALAVYDRQEFGGNGDHWISPEDSIWPWLKLWIDESHDGISDPDEISDLDDHQVARIALKHHRNTRSARDGNGNSHRFQGTFLKKVRVGNRTFLRDQLVVDVFFAVAE